jgi:HlyD family secretion protein
MRRLSVVAVLAILGAAGVWTWKGRSAPESPEAARQQTALVERGSLRTAVAASGRVVANLDVEIKAKSSGEIVRLPFDLSDSVKKGELLLELDPSDEQRRLEQAEVSLAASKARLAQARQSVANAQSQATTGKKSATASVQAARARAAEAKAKADRAKMLWEEKLISQQEYDTARSSALQAAADVEVAAARMEESAVDQGTIELRRQDVLQAEAQLQSAQVDLTLAQQRVRDTLVHAPMDGVVTAREVQIGQIISSGISNVGGGTTVLVLSDLSRLFVLASVDESDIGSIAAGQSSLITVDAFPGQRFRGRVERIAPRGVNNQNVVTFEVKIAVLGRNKDRLRPEMTANVEIVTTEKDDALLVPAAAVVRSRNERLVTVVLPDGTTEERTVETGLADATRVEVTAGLAEGESVLVPEETDSRWRRGQSDADRARQRAQRMMMSGGAGGGRRGGR